MRRRERSRHALALLPELIPSEMWACLHQHVGNVQGLAIRLGAHGLDRRDAVIPIEQEKGVVTHGAWAPPQLALYGRRGSNNLSRKKFLEKAVNNRSVSHPLKGSDGLAYIQPEYTSPIHWKDKVIAVD